MVPKKSIFERMGLIEPKNDNENSELSTIDSEETGFELIPEPDHIPDLSDLMSENESSNNHNEHQLHGNSYETALFNNEQTVADNLAANTVKFEAIAMDSVDSKNSNEEVPQNISDKLDLIIGAYEKNKMLTIEEIYRNAHLDSDLKKTIFMADVYLKAVPENLPVDIKRETVFNIMNISNISLDELLNDAYRRIDSLNTVLEETVSTTQDVFNRNDATIRELEKRIEDLREINKNRKKFQEDQNTMIEYEIQKIINLVEFVKPKK